MYEIYTFHVGYRALNDYDNQIPFTIITGNLYKMKISIILALKIGGLFLLLKRDMEKLRVVLIPLFQKDKNELIPIVSYICRLYRVDNLNLQRQQ